MASSSLVRFCLEPGGDALALGLIDIRGRGGSRRLHLKATWTNARRPGTPFVLAGNVRALGTLMLPPPALAEGAEWQGAEGEDQAKCSKAI